jgi:hypothetical protein
MIKEENPCMGDNGAQTGPSSLDVLKTMCGTSSEKNEVEVKNIMGEHHRRKVEDLRSEESRCRFDCKQAWKVKPPQGGIQILSQDQRARSRPQLSPEPHVLDVGDERHLFHCCTIFPL